MQKLTYIEKAAKKAKISKNMAQQIVLSEHELGLIPKNKLKKIEIKIGGKDGISFKAFREFDKIAKALDVSVDAVIVTMLTNYLEGELEKK